MFFVWISKCQVRQMFQLFHTVDGLQSVEIHFQVKESTTFQAIFSSPQSLQLDTVQGFLIKLDMKPCMASSGNKHFYTK